MKNSTISKQWSYTTDLYLTNAYKSRKLSMLWLMLLTLLLLPTSMVAQTDYDTSVTFNALAGKPEGFDNEKYTNLFDGLKDPGNSTKWCGKFVSNGGTYVIFEASKAGIPVGYTITTGNDNSAYKGRNPRSWKLYGNNEGKNGAWTLIQEVSYDTKLQDVNCASYDFTCEGSTPYKYFKWEITGIKNKDYIQVGEFELKLNTGYQVYAEFDEGTGTLTFKYGPSTSKPEGAYKLNVGPYSPKWDAQKEKIKTVVFDASFANIRPTSCYRWFYGCKNLTNIEGIENLNTENVTYMNSMFNECTALKSLDLTNFNTAKVTNMSYMFNECTALASLNVSKFNTAEVKDMDFMFYNCSTLTSLNLSNFNNAKVTTMISMFNGCTKLESLDLSKFNTAEVTDMGCMFYNCSALTSLNLSNFNTAKVTNMSAMFENCSALTTIYASDKFVTGQVSFSTDMFSGCKNLFGAIGYDETKTNNKDYANLVDGYFSPEGGFHAYAEFDEGTGTLTFRRGVSMPTGAYELNEGRSNPKWYDKREKINKVVFDASFASARPTSCYYWFTGCSNLTTIEGIEYLNTEKVTDMICMFFHCSSLTSLDLSNFNTANVTDMGYMFNGCSALTTIFVSDKFVTDLVTKSTDMFSDCKNLIGAIKYDGSKTNNKDYANMVTGYFTPKGGFPGYAKFDEGTGTLTFTSGPSKPEGAYDLNVGINYPGWWFGQSGKIKTVVFDASFANARPTSCYCWFSGCNNLTEIKGIEYLNTENVTNMGFMFNSCKVLTSLNLSNFNTEKVTDMQGMFGECWDLTSLDLTSFNTEKVTNMRHMFFNCSDLTSLNLSKFNTEKVMYMSNMFYNCNKLTSLDLTSFNTAEVTKMDNMFKSCSALTSLDLSNFNTAKVTDMNYMFYGCSDLTSLDITSFNTAEVTDMSSMFRSCFALTSLDLTNFNTAKVMNMSDMFRLCKALTSLDLSNFNTAKVENMGWMFKSCYALTSLDITSFNTANVTNMTQMFYESNALTTIYASDKFVTSKDTKSVNMFKFCSSLKDYNDINIDCTYANYKTGYFSKLVGKNGNDKIGATGETLATENLALDDEKDFVAYEPFAAKTASYIRKMKAGTTWGTLCLPFEVSLDGQNFRAFELGSVNNDEVVLKELNTIIPAGTPVIIKMINGATELSFNVANKEIAKDVLTPESADGNYQLQGLYTQKVFSKDADNNCYIVKGNKLMNPAKLLANTNVEKVVSKPFRAYMVDKTSAPTAGAKMFSIGFDDDSITTIDTINTIANDKAEYYDLQGKRLNEPQKGINIVKRGNKTMKVIIK
ncbi:BspA family leucine-rich repeat surface protein [Prevotella sp.]|uniref:BspA family leucine-rich repeat surface protein n=1 Tax=Prevotella sp. TaxID=59823 RepID=UPI0027E22082|nr:BspA family leucine-rich repeat surface protein [Prevotella sp.]